VRPAILLPDVTLIFAVHAALVGGFHRKVKTITAFIAALNGWIRRIGTRRLAQLTHPQGLKTPA